MDNCLVLKLRKSHTALILADHGEIFNSIESDYVNGRINTLTYRHFINKYAVNHDNNLQITGTKTNLVDIVYSSDYRSGVSEYLKLIRHLHDGGIKFKKVYHKTFLRPW